MKLVHIEFCNIGSYGNKMQSIDFDTNGKLILLQGPSGTGKSTLLKLPCLLFYGKISQTKMTDIANRINKNGYLKGIIKDKDIEYVIERKFQPNSVKVYKNGEDIDNYGVKDAQSYILENIIKLPYQIFTNIISLSAKSFKSFLNMSPEDRRQIIDRVFNLETVNEIYTLIKKDIKDTGLSINSDNTQIYTLTNAINKAHQELNKLSQETNKDNNEKIIANNKIIEQATQKINAYTSKYQEYSNIYNNNNAILQHYNSEIQKLSIDKNLLLEKQNLFSQDKCPTCGTSFDSDNFKDLSKKIKDKITEVDKNILQFQTSQQNLISVMNSYSQALRTLNNSIQDENNKINKAKASNFALNETLKQSGEYKSVQKIIDSNSESLNNAKQQLQKDTDSYNDLVTLSTLYSIEGVKKIVIKNYLPQLNKEIQHSLERLNFPYQLTFNENFDSQLTDLGNPIGSNTLSDGEHSRIDLAVLCSIFKLLKRKYPTINIFTLDEFLSSLDSVTAAALLRFLKDFADEIKLNIFVVSHVDMEADLFDEQIQVNKEMRFSNLEIIDKENI